MPQISQSCKGVNTIAHITLVWQRHSCIPKIFFDGHRSINSNIKHGMGGHKEIATNGSIIDFTCYLTSIQLTLSPRVSEWSYSDNAEQWTDHSDRSKCGKSRETSQVCQSDRPEHPYKGRI